MEERRKITLGGLWCSLYPTFLYPLLQTICGVIYLMMVSVPFVRADLSWSEVESKIMQLYLSGSMWILLIAAVVSIPLFGWLYCRDMQKKRDLGWWDEGWFPLREEKLLWTMLGSAALALFCNQLVSLLPLSFWVRDLEEVNEALDTGTIWMQMMVAGCLVPLVEELVMRGLMYQRFRRMLRPVPAMFWSALAFGIFHGNVIQGVYAFLLGLFFAWLMERFQRLWVPVVAHMSANLFVLLIDDGGWLTKIYSSGEVFLGVMAGSGVVFLVAFWMLREE